MSLTCIGCLEIEDTCSSSIPFSTADGWKTKRWRARCRNPLVSHLRYASQVIQIRSQDLHPDGCRPFKFIQGNNITLAHCDEPYMQKYGKIMDTRFHELLIDHESKTRLLKTQSHTSERRGYEADEADKERQEKSDRKKVYP